MLLPEPIPTLSEYQSKEDGGEDLDWHNVSIHDAEYMCPVRKVRYCELASRITLTRLKISRVGERLPAAGECL
jgi:hypothetical protein